eukprot:CAMPEP_0194210646 /NCGR_PEP_ID=MMETSP0156-20130528/8891_1 /TAXON_ID=33649 /ORGANISM="Thalassionema nitzschioides, Strain L26-B" /LENGTH=291 /DNA_ID=CAMNT_0038938017 /DNA_START=100 /DNA_END=975 /DNA_ORIENTATION=-
MSRLKRKRIQEGRRRLEFKEAFESLTQTLLDFDKDFSLEHEQREKLTSTRLSAKKKSESANDDGKNSLFSRVELLNQAIFTIKSLNEEVAEYKNHFAELGSGRKTVEEIVQSNRKKSKVCYHHGVGPVVSDEKSETDAESSKEPRESNLLAGAMRQSLPTNLALGQGNSLLPCSSIFNMQQNQQQQLLGQIQLQEYQRRLLESQLSMTSRPSPSLSSVLSQSMQNHLPSADALQGQFSQDILLRSALAGGRMNDQSGPLGRIRGMTHAQFNQLRNLQNANGNGQSPLKSPR